MMCWILIFEGKKKKSSGVEGRCTLEETQHQMKDLKGFVVSQNTIGYGIALMATMFGGDRIVPHF